jgi:hypothetical protein
MHFNLFLVLISHFSDAFKGTNWAFFAYIERKGSNELKNSFSATTTPFEVILDDSES